MMNKSLEDIIRTYIPLKPATSKGWEKVNCAVCNNHVKKGMRGGFKFSDKETGYHCFNCGHDTRYNPDTHTRINKDMVKVLESFGIPKKEWLHLVIPKKQHEISEQPEEPKLNINPVETHFPPHFYKLTSGKDDWSALARVWLELRGISYNDYPFYLSTSKRWLGRVIIPYYKDGKLVFYQGRDMMDQSSSKYIDAAVPTVRPILYGYNRLFENRGAPLFVCEGFFNAYSIDGVALVTKRIYPEQEEWLNRSQRQKVLVPDPTGGSQSLIDRFIELGWGVSILNLDDKDANMAVVEYSKMFVIARLLNNIKTGNTAKVESLMRIR